MSLDIDLVIRHDRCPVCGRGDDDDIVYSSNITHNLGKMAQEVEIYQAVWHPEVAGITQAKQLIQPLQHGIAELKDDPERFRRLEPENKWGTYDDFVPWLEKYLEACKDYPDAYIRASR